MHGKILDYNSDMKTGFLRDEGDNKYHFFIGDCINPEKIKMGVDVDFEHDGESATQIIVIDKASNKSVVEANNSKKMAVKKSKKNVSVLLILILVLAISALITVVIISEIQGLKSKKVEKKYEVQISNIKKYLLDGDCSNATLEYNQAKNTRNEIYKYGHYYSIETHSQHAHALEIAECFTDENDFENAVKMLDIKNANSVDYFNRAAAIYQKSGDTETALEAQKRAKEIVP